MHDSGRAVSLSLDRVFMLQAIVLLAIIFISSSFLFASAPALQIPSRPSVNSLRSIWCAIGFHEAQGFKPVGVRRDLSAIVYAFELEFPTAVINMGSQLRTYFVSSKALFFLVFISW